VLSVEDGAEVRRLHRSKGLPIKAIARVLGISWNTVRAALAWEAPKYERPRKKSIVDAVEPQICVLLQVYPRMPATVIAERISWTRSIRVVLSRVEACEPGPRVEVLDEGDDASTQPARSCSPPMQQSPGSRESLSSGAGAAGFSPGYYACDQLGGFWVAAGVAVSCRAVCVVAAVVLMLAGLPRTASATPVSAWRYVALGDSYASGPGIPVQRVDQVGCQRSTRNYPARLAAALGISDYTDVSCGGARTEDMTAAQPVPQGPNPPQFAALTPVTDLVTVTLGGNDINIGDLWMSCARLGPTDPLGNPCQRQATVNGTDLYRQRIAIAAPKIAQVLESIRQHAPRAKVLLVGYLRVLPMALGCYPLVPIARGDVPYVDGVEQQLNAMLAAQAHNHGAVFVDTYTRSQDHDACQPPTLKWVEGTTPTSPASPIHPNALGMQQVATLAQDLLM
jgi:lysophospholipase L1-like esterase